MGYMSEAAKVRDMPEVMKYIAGDIADIGCGPDKIKPEAIGFDGRNLPGVDIVVEDLEMLIDSLDYTEKYKSYDTVFSSHFLEHCANQYAVINDWHTMLNIHGHLVLYLPDGRYYNNRTNLEHLIDMNYEQFMFWFGRSFCGEGKNYLGESLYPFFELVDHGMDIGDDRYSFYVIARKV